MSRDFSGAAGTYLNGADSAGVDIAGPALTVAGWCKVDALGTTRQIVAKSGGSAASRQYILGMQFTGNLPVFIIAVAGVNQTVVGSAAVVAGAWMHLVGVHDSPAQRIYRNGVLEGSDTGAGSIQNTGETFKIGTETPSAEMWDGNICEVGVWDAALSAGEIAALAKGVCPSFIRRGNLRGYWPIHGIGTVEADLSGQRQSLTPVGTVPAARHFGVGRLAPFAG